MATQRQIQANRLNARQSTGPRTPEGKAVSSQNALKSGLDAESQFVVGEDRDEFAQLQHEYFVRFQPLTPEERFQVDTLTRNEWTLRRLFRAEAHLWEYHAMRADRSEGVPLGAALMAADEVFRRLQRRITLAERSYRDALAQLERLRHDRGPLADTHPARPQSQPNAGDSPELGSFFHPSESPWPPSDSDSPRLNLQVPTTPGPTRRLVPHQAIVEFVAAATKHPAGGETRLQERSITSVFARQFH